MSFKGCRLAASVLVLGVAVVKIASSQDRRMSEPLKSELHKAIDVRVEADKAVYEVGEPVELSLTLENVGPRPFYVYPKVRYGWDGDGVFRVYVHPESGCSSFGHGEAIDAVGADPKSKLAPYIEKNWRLLEPRDTISLDAALETNLCPGKNTIHVRYFTKLQAWSPSQVSEAESEWKYPAAFGSYDGNSVVVPLRTETNDPRGRK